MYKELETGCLRAVPDNEAAAQYFLDFFAKSDEERAELGKQTRELFEKHFQWHLSGNKWEQIFDNFEFLQPANLGCTSRIHTPAPKPPQDQIEKVPAEQAKWLITNVLGEPEKLNSFIEARMTRDLLYKSATGSTGGMYFNESSAAFDGMNQRHPFDFDIAYQNMADVRKKK